MSAQEAVALEDDEPAIIEIGARGDRPGPAEFARMANDNVLSALLASRKTYGRKTVALEDGDKRVLTYDALVRAIAALSRVIKRDVKGDVVGIFLASSVPAVVAYFAVLAAGKTPAMLNFTAGRTPLLAACRNARISAILSARRFLSMANLEEMAEALKEAAPVIALEDMRERVTTRDKAFAAAAAPLGLFPKPGPDEAAAIIFTSGSEGDPKGVVLTHRNFLANAIQIESALPLDRAKTFFNPLPIFHSYGLGPGVILPLIRGRKLVVHPSPLRAKEIAQRVKETEANVLLATDTFLRQYVRAGDPGSLASLMLAVCGAERVRVETREMVRSRFGFAVLEGYGVTETSPVLAVNHPDDIRDGTVGRFLPGIEARLVKVAGLTEGRRLQVRGPNVMAGYLESGSGRLVPPPNGWHDTGDVVAYDGEGFLSIRGRLKRFAKIGGEMTSLVVVENLAGAVWPDTLHAAASVPGDKRGELIILLTEEPDADPRRLHEALKSEGLPERYLPHQIIKVDAIPVLQTGKVDNVRVVELANTLRTARG